MPRKRNKYYSLVKECVKLCADFSTINDTILIKKLIITYVSYNLLLDEIGKRGINAKQIDIIIKQYQEYVDAEKKK